MGIRQTRIFVANDEAEEHWAETLMGRVVRPLIQCHAESFEWFWFSRYGKLCGETEDCAADQIPATHQQPGPDGHDRTHRSLRLRYAVADDHQDDIEAHARALIAEYGYCITDFRPYFWVADTGSPRFLGVEHRLPDRAEQRAHLVTRFYMATAQLVLDALVGPDEQGRFRLESNDDLLQNPRGSSFQSLHHLYCNITATPTDVCVFQKAGVEAIGFGTHISAPPAPTGGWDHVTAYPIWF